MLSLLRDNVQDIQKDLTLIHLLEEMKGEMEAIRQELNDMKNLMMQSTKPVNLLTKRENDIYCLLGEGRTNLYIANHLGISEKTVKNHVSRIMKKLKVKNRTEAVIKIYKSGLSLK